MTKKTIKLPERPNQKFSSISEFNLGPLIGDGGFAKVRRATHKISKIKYAIKIMRLSSMGSGDKENIEKEIEIHSSIDSPHVVKLVDFFEENGMIYMILELMTKGNLYQYMYKQFPLSQKDALKFWRGTVQAIEYLHSLDIYMRDLKSENVLLDESLNVQICDFGWASRMSDIEYRQLQGGTYVYMSPESLRGELQDLSSDIWALGVLLFELIHYHEPYKIGLSSKEQLKIIQENEIIFKTDLDERIKNLILKLMSKQKENRLTAKQILEIEWVKREIDGTKQIGNYSYKQFDSIVKLKEFPVE
jgi:serine/threonine protein kinase